jgi:hypothetical protein
MKSERRADDKANRFLSRSHIWNNREKSQPYGFQLEDRLNESEIMKNKGNEANARAHQLQKQAKNEEPGYPLYPANEDIFSKSREEKDIDPEDSSKAKEPSDIHTIGKNNEKAFSDDVSGNDLDVPGSELDDDQERIGSEDEENNYYSLGGDDHNDLDEDTGD